MKPDWSEQMILRMSRKYTENECIQGLLKMVSGLQKEIGVLKSDLSEAEDKIKKLEHRIHQTPNKDLAKDEAYTKIDRALKIVSKELGKVRKERDKWRDKVIVSKIQNPGNAQP